MVLSVFSGYNAVIHSILASHKLHKIEVDLAYLLCTGEDTSPPPPPPPPQTHSGQMTRWYVFVPPVKSKLFRYIIANTVGVVTHMQIGLR